jgi:hypothetical protein
MLDLCLIIGNRVFNNSGGSGGDPFGKLRTGELHDRDMY